MEMMVAMVQSRDAQRRRMAGGHIGGPVEKPPKRRRRRVTPGRVRPVFRVRRGLARTLVAVSRAIEPPAHEPRPACPPAR